MLRFTLMRALGLGAAGGPALALLAQAAEPAPASTGFWEQHAEKIWLAVITAVIGALVGALLAEPLKAAVRGLGRRLDRWLQGFGWRFRKRYRAALVEGHRWLDLIGFSSQVHHLERPRLREVFVSLRVAAGRSAQSARFSWHQAFTGEERRVVVLGPPGSGKSTLLRYLLLVLCGEGAHALRERLGRPFPLYARLRDLEDEGERSTLPGLLRAAAPTRVPSAFPERWLERGGCIVLLDGLDEVLDEARHRRAAEAIRRLVADYPDNRYAVTCRVAGWSGQLPGFATYEIEALGDDDIRKFLGSWHREVLRGERLREIGPDADPERRARAVERARAEGTAQADDLWRELASNEGLLWIARTPLILSLIALVRYFRVTRLPQGRAELYRRCLEVLLELWDLKDKQLRSTATPSLNDKLLVLRAIAFHFLENDLLDAGKAVLEQVVEPLLPQLSPEVAGRISAADLIEQLRQRSGILEEQAIERYGFAHRGLHDYLAAAHVAGEELDRVLGEHAGEERWREVILIAAGLVPPRRATRLVRALLELEAVSPAALEIAGRALGEDVKLGDDLRDEVRRRLLDRLESEEAPGAFGRLASALLAADLEAARSWMGEVLRGRDPLLRQRVLELLPELGEDHGRALVPLLAELAGAAGEEAAVRARSALALAGLGVAPDAAVWQALAAARREPDEALKAAATWAWCALGRYEELGLVEVPAGEFLMGSPEGEGGSDEQPRHSLFLPTFYIGRHPVTVAQFRAFVEQSGMRPGGPHALRGEDDHPVVSVSWDEALAYARWHGLTLPGEAEWEKAARGTEGRRFPWGDEWRTGLANTAERRSTGRALPRFVAKVLHRRPVSMRTTPVGHFSPAGDSPYGGADMAGNVWEWTRSAFGRYPYDPRDGREDLEATDRLRVLRGGSFVHAQGGARCAYRLRNSPDLRYDNVGFRVVASPFSSGL